ncbi:MAG: class I SAM-dependent methyltransferase [Verrucomicrobia bacterium]|nr:class I SAM-dependent methyltransferase [Verrucomicrobiota bacterium]
MAAVNEFPMLTQALQAIRYFAANPRYTVLYQFGSSSAVCSQVFRQPRARYALLAGELKQDPRFGHQLSHNFSATVHETFTLNEDHGFIYALVRLGKPKLIVETGVFDGVFSACFLQGLHVNATQDGVEGSLISIDLPAYEPIAASTNRMLRTNLPKGREPGWVIPDYLRPRWQLHLGDSRELLPRIGHQAGDIDLFFHDSLHTYAHMMFEYQTVWPLLKPGALLLSHDFHWNRAFRDFSREHRQRDLVAHGFGIVRKT